MGINKQIETVNNESQSHNNDHVAKTVIVLALIIMAALAVIKSTGNWDRFFKPHDTEFSSSNQSNSAPKYSLAPVMITSINKGFSDLSWGQSPKATKKLKLKKTDNTVNRYEPVDYTLQSPDTQLLGITASYYSASPNFWFYRNKLLSIQAFYANADKVITELYQTLDRPDYTLSNGFPHGINMWNLEKVIVRFIPLNGYCVVYVNHKALIKSLNDERRKHNLEEW